MRGGPVEEGAASDTLEFLLRSLRDLEAEHDAGDLDDADYQVLKDDYTARAAAALRSREAPPSSTADPAVSTEPPATVDPGSSATADPGSSTEPPAGLSTDTRRPRRRWRRTLVLAAGLVILAAGLVWAIRAATSTRGPGDTVTGQQLGQDRIAQLLASAQQALGKGDAVSAIKDYQQVLRSDPRQVDALTGEGWLLAQTQRPDLVKQGLGLLQSAERVDPTYTPAHLYRGVTLVAQGDNQAAIPELNYYLTHNPDPAVKDAVERALARAQAAVTPTTTAP